MGITENAAYLKGLFEGYELDVASKEGRIISGMLDLIADMADKISALEADNRELHEYVEELDGKFDKVLCDVPCSGLGIIFKKPDIKYKSINNINGLPRVQYEILSNCARYVKKGGILIYSTCTLNKQENQENVHKFLAKNESFEAVDFEINDVKSQNGSYTFMPHINGTDGFFVAKMRRVK